MKRGLQLAAVGAVLAAGLSQDQSPRPVLPHHVFNSADVTYATAVFELSRNYMVTHGIGDAAMTQLVFVGGNSSFLCRNPTPAYTRRLSRDAPTQYCPEDRVTAHTAVSNNAEYALGAGALGVEIMIDHEFGHDIQRHLGTLDPVFTATPDQTSAAVEIQATCYAGMLMQGQHPWLVPRAADYLRTIPSDGLHGTPAQQAAAFLQGATTGVC